MDSAAAADDSLTPPISILRRRNSTGTPTKPHHLFSTSASAATSTTTTDTSSSSSFSVDFELVSIKPTSYTSLRDILPSLASAVHSPKPPCLVADSGYEISIRNRLVKQAAWAYLQPMSSTSPQPHHGSTVFHRLWTQLSGALLRLITAAFDCLQLNCNR